MAEGSTFNVVSFPSMATNLCVVSAFRLAALLISSATSSSVDSSFATIYTLTVLLWSLSMLPAWLFQFPHFPIRRQFLEGFLLKILDGQLPLSFWTFRSSIRFEGPGVVESRGLYTSLLSFIFFHHS